MLTDNQTFRIWSTGWVQKKCGKVADFRTLNQGLVLRVHQQCSELWNNLKKHPNGSVQLSRSVMSNSLQSHELQHARPPCSSPTPGVYPNSCPLSQWCHPTISSSVIPFSSCPQSFPASGSFQMSQLFMSGGQNTGVSASTSVLPVNTQDWSPLGWTGWIALQSKGLARVFSNTTIQKHQLLSHPYMTTGKTIALTIWTFVDKVMSLFFNILSRFFIDKPRKQTLLLSFQGASVF